MQGCRSKEGGQGVVFGRSVNPIRTRGADFSRHITTALPNPPTRFLDDAASLDYVRTYLKNWSINPNGIYHLYKMQRINQYWPKQSYDTGSTIAKEQSKLALTDRNIKMIWIPCIKNTFRNMHAKTIPKIDLES